MWICNANIESLVIPRINSSRKLARSRISINYDIYLNYIDSVLDMRNWHDKYLHFSANESVCISYSLRVNKAIVSFSKTTRMYL